MPDAGSIRVRLYLYTDTTGTFWFDDFGLDQGAAARHPFQTGFPVVASGWVFFSSPTVADTDGTGGNELLIGAGGAVNGWDSTGTRLSGFPLSTGDRFVVGQLALGDLDRDHDLEIVVGTGTSSSSGHGHVFVWHHDGDLVTGWPQSVAWNAQYGANRSWVSSVALADIDGPDQADLEILATTTNNASYYTGSTPPPTYDVYAWHANGLQVSGEWPTTHTIAGIYGALAAGDIDGNGIADVIVSRDHHYLNAYATDGTSLPGWPICTYVDGNAGDFHTDIRVEYGTSAPALADLDADGTVEYIVTGNTKGPGNDSSVHNSGLLVLEPDGTRHPRWQSAALGSGTLGHVDMPRQAPAIADLDDDGQLEIVVASHDGWIRAYSPDQTVLWSFNYTEGATLFASEPVIGDVDGDGALEVVFGTYVPLEREADRHGPVGLWGLEADGTVMMGFPLVASTPGVRAAPTLADLDGDGDLEILAATRTGLIFAWDTGAPNNLARLPWPTGRHDIRRTADYQARPPVRDLPYSAYCPLVTK
jgi:hypothetical protein